MMLSWFFTKSFKAFIGANVKEHELFDEDVVGKFLIDLSPTDIFSL